MSLPPIRELNLPLMINNNGSTNPVVEVLPNCPEFIFYNNIPYCSKAAKDWGYYVIMTSRIYSLHIKTAYFNQASRTIEDVDQNFLRRQPNRPFSVTPFNYMITMGRPVPQVPSSIFYNGNKYTAKGEYHENGLVYVDTINALGVQLQAYIFYRN